jgi:hypothetical protein
MRKSQQMGSRSRKSHQNTLNDNPQHTQIRRGSIRLCITSNQSPRDLSNEKYSVRGQSINPCRNAGTKQRYNNYPRIITNPRLPFDLSASNRRERTKMHTDLQHINHYLYGRRNRLETYK